MKLKSNGSVQCKKTTGWCYFVTRDNWGKQVWVPLKTKDPAEAVRRAELLAGAPGVGCERERWLEYLAGVGEKAATELRGAAAAGLAESLRWDGLFEAWRAKADQLTDNAGTLTRYEGQLGMLSGWCAELGIEPGELGDAEAQEYLNTRPAASQQKDVMLFKRMWADLALDGGVWHELVKKRAVKVPFRRLSVAEVEAVVRAFNSGVDKPCKKGEWKRLPVFADLVQLGYYTALRRKNVVLLNAEDVAEDGEFLETMAFKTLHASPVPLRIPLLEPARVIVARRMADAGSDGFLFPELIGASMGKAQSNGFKRAGVARSRLGRASFHSLRHTFVSLMDDAEVQGYLTDAITGHKREKGMHGHYSHPARERLMAAVARAIPLLEV